MSEVANVIDPSMNTTLREEVRGSSGGAMFDQTKEANRLWRYLTLWIANTDLEREQSAKSNVDSRGARQTRRGFCSDNSTALMELI